MPQSPLSLSDDEYSAIMLAAAPIHPAERGMFLLKLADELARHSVVGEGLVHRLGADLQRRCLIEARKDAEVGDRGRPRGPGRPTKGQEADAGPPLLERPPAARPGAAASLAAPRS